jgi:pantothenate kinase
MQIQIEGTTNKSDNYYLILDIGGTLCKVCIVEIKNNSMIYFWISLFIYLENSLWITSLPSSNLLKIKETIKSELKFVDFDFGKIYVTGGGSYKYSDEIKLIFGKFSIFDEMESTVKGVFFFLNKLRNEQIAKPKFPMILANVGTGASFIFIDENGKFTRIGGTNIAGGTLTGIFSLSKQQNSLIDLSNCIENGNKNNVDILVRDIYGKDYEAIGLNGGIVAGSLAKIDHYGGKNWTGDICASSAYMICSNLVHLLYLYASVHGALSVLFSGSFVMIPAISTLLKNITISKFSGKFESHILGFGGYLGCFGIASDLISE